MNQIKILDEVIANQIAAGEVVERPQSVVKELIENALDAGASQIDVDIEEGGLKKIVVADNGHGMAAEDAVLCFSRYATSKLTDPSDLLSLSTFGFRGEALPSIASVAKVELLTKQSTAAATKICLEAGKVVDIGTGAAPQGTRVEVRDLFFNVPARLKFLKSDRSELSAIENVVRMAALSAPNVGFSLRAGGRRMLDIPATPVDAVLDSPRSIERAILCLSDEVRGWIYPFQAAGESVKLNGYVVAPLVTRRDFRGIRLFVNGRPIEDRQMQQTVKVAFQTLLEVGRYPICALDIRVDPAAVDVNVHPRKLEVRFSSSQNISGQIIRLLSDFLATTPWLRGNFPPLAKGAGGFSENPLGFSLRADASTLSLDPSPASGRGEESPQLLGNMLGGALHYSELRVLGQSQGTFLFLDSPSGVVVLDQHAAHERVVFQNLREKLSQGHLPSQPLLFPIQINLSGEEADLVERHRTLFHHYGIELDLNGERSAVIRAVPVGVKIDLAAQLITDALSQLSHSGRADVLHEIGDAICAQIACHSSIRKGQSLDVTEIEALLRELDTIELAAHCPHGRPIARSLPFGEMARWFSRL